MNQITIDELVSELDKIQSELPGAADGVTVHELVEAWGVHDDLVRKRLRALNKNGRLIVGKRRTRDITGKPSWTPVYKLTRNDNKEARKK